MKRLKTKELTVLSVEQRIDKLNNLRTELTRLKSKAARGTLKKELGEIRSVRRNIARVLTSLNSEGNRTLQEGETPESEGMKSKTDAATEGN